MLYIYNLDTENTEWKKHQEKETKELYEYFSKIPVNQKLKCRGYEDKVCWDLFFPQLPTLMMLKDYFAQIKNEK